MMVGLIVIACASMTYESFYPAVKGDLLLKCVVHMSCIKFFETYFCEMFLCEKYRK